MAVAFFISLQGLMAMTPVDAFGGGMFSDCASHGDCDSAEYAGSVRCLALPHWYDGDGLNWLR